ncbi:uncharacterized protein LOC135503299 [Lineus longissimus]|uniref:uncharacterized protein LOC135503299 n=1 Tax=Lineus longissimus TaxID=88925 RepID=UPI00315D6299
MEGLRRSKTDIRLPKHQVYNKELEDCTEMSQRLNLTRPRLGRHTAHVRRLPTQRVTTAVTWSPDMLPTVDDVKSTSTSSAEIDRVTGQCRRRHHLTSHELCRILDNNGKGDPRDTAQEMRFLPFRNRRTGIYRDPGLHRHLIHQSKKDCRKAFAKVAIFCEHEIARRISSASDQYRNRYRYLQFIDFLDGKESNNDDVIRRRETAKEPTLNGDLPDDLCSRIQNWVLDCDEAVQTEGWELENERFDYSKYRSAKGLVS